MSVLNQLLSPLLERATSIVHRHVSDQTLAQVNEICGRLAGLAQIAPLTEASIPVCHKPGFRNNGHRNGGTP